MSIAASVLATAVLAESEHAVELAAPTWVFGAVALPCFLMPGDLDIIPARTDAARRDGRLLVAEIGFAVLPAAHA